MPIKYETWPIRHIGGQHVGTGPSGVRGMHYIGEYPTGIEACCEYHQSQHKNRLVVQEMIEWALASANIKEIKDV
jgi:protein subunit release factor A